MKNLFLFGAAALVLGGCDGGTCDTGDSACEEVSEDLIIEFVDGSCAGTTCTWYVEANGEMGDVELELAETGDTVSDPFWTEFHDDFSVAGFEGDTYEKKQIKLTLVNSFEDQVKNQTTILDVSKAEIAEQLTVMFYVKDPNGNYADCAVYGHKPSHFAGDCTNNWN